MQLAVNNVVHAFGETSFSSLRKNNNVCDLELTIIKSLFNKISCISGAFF